MQLSDLVRPDRIFTDLKPNSKKQLLQQIARLGADATGLDERVIFDSLNARERVGSTGIGNGFALPHDKFAGLSDFTVLFVRLSKPVDFDSIDDAPVDLVFVLLAPEGSGAEHLKALSRIARVMREPDMLTRLREARDVDQLNILLTRERQPDAA